MVWPISGLLNVNEKFKSDMYVPCSYEYFDR